MFLAAKILAFATQPLAWAMLLLCTGLLLMQRWQKAGVRFCQAALLLLVLSGWQVPPEALMRTLESRYPAPTANADLSGYAGVVVLGGALERAALWEFPGRIALKGEAERMVVPVGLLQRNPRLRLLFTGGEEGDTQSSLSEAERAKIFFDQLGVDPQRVVYEARSRTTYENAILSAQVPGVDIQQPWLLLTTAAHLPRSMAVFEKAGWNVTPYGVDYRTAASTDLTAYSLRGGAEKWHYALHEIFGYWMYRATGRI